jgi:hypothetical protein
MPYYRNKPTDKGTRGPDNIWLGIAIGVALTFCGLRIATSVRSLVAVVAFGAVQLIWIVPLCLICIGMGKKEIAKGLAIIGGIVFLLNAGCWGMVMMFRSGR